ncbi:thiamine-phosphate kinase [Cellvibrio sp.]|uniref:thiamine-phosphate kinase n=1 Tax=Cellvibrio sp. TaxID=1965322 RepID=UPI00396480B4
MREFELIRKFFQHEQADLLLEEKAQASVVLGIGDDCALLQIPTSKQLAISVDTLVADVHFPADAKPDDIAERALRTNLSDLAAMGAEPLWFTLALTLPKNSEYLSEEWLRGFSRGLFRTANQYEIVLVGGDTTSGPFSITIQAMGAVDSQYALRRDGASVGDFICVTNYLGDGAAALAVIQNGLQLDETHEHYLRERFYRPTPRLAEVNLLRSIASSALDISDGLVADLNHICEASDVGAVIDVENLPLSPALLALNDVHQARTWVLSGGDDYELCFTVPPEKMPELAMLIAQEKINATVVGEIISGSGVRCELDGETYELDSLGYQHF